MKHKEIDISKDINALHNAKYKTIKSIDDFEKAYNDLTQKKYHSEMAERHRYIKGRKNIQISKSEQFASSKYKKLVHSFIYQLNNEVSLEDLENMNFIQSKENLHKISFDGNGRFWSSFIKDDVIYMDELNLIKRFGKWKIQIKKYFFTPITMDKLSLTAQTARLDFWRNFKVYTRQIKYEVYK